MNNTNQQTTINIREPLSVISRYIENPFLIDGFKFDLRMYVLLNFQFDSKTNYEISEEIFKSSRIWIYNQGIIF